jgi:hypothetical protein
MACNTSGGDFRHFNSSLTKFKIVFGKGINFEPVYLKPPPLPTLIVLPTKTTIFLNTYTRTSSTSPALMKAAFEKHMF